MGSQSQERTYSVVFVHLVLNKYASNVGPEWSLRILIEIYLLLNDGSVLLGSLQVCKLKFTKLRVLLALLFANWQIL